MAAGKGRCPEETTSHGHRVRCRKTSGHDVLQSAVRPIHVAERFDGEVVTWVVQLINDPPLKEA